ncbi:MAG: phospholipid carrier-dependent glycosyltransferase [Methylobacter sp.]|nr:MAG: phospholipid carrier-dependent glycosyltransferase [Methylobacter sp.]
MCYRFLPAKAWVISIWAGLTTACLINRPLLPIDETRYFSVAWEMWTRQEFLVPLLNGEAYSDKPPLLFWLIHACWLVFGVNETLARYIAPLFSLLVLQQSRRLALDLWPRSPQAGELVPFLLLGSVFWMIYDSLTLFDMVLSFFVLLAVANVWRLATQSFSIKSWLVLSLALGCGLLAKGPVVFAHVLPVALSAPWWAVEQGRALSWRRWYAGLFLAVLASAMLALSWAVPAGIAGGEEYRSDIFWDQTGKRLIDSIAHSLPWWWYFQTLPLLLLPWLVWAPFWQGMAKLPLSDKGVRFCLAWLLPVLLVFSLVSGKRLHYLLPVLPAMALLIARAVSCPEAVNSNSAYRSVLVVFALLGLGFALIALTKPGGWFHPIAEVSPQWGLSVTALALAVLALGGSKALNDQVVTICLVSVAGFALMIVGFFQAYGPNYDTRPMAVAISELITQGREVVFYTGKYYGQYQFTGRLQQPLTVISERAELEQWIYNHPQGYVLAVYKARPELDDRLLAARYPFRTQQSGLVSCRTLLANPGLIGFLRS